MRCSVAGRLAVLSLLAACGPDAELLERVVRLEAAVETLQADADKRKTASEAPVKCAQAKKTAFDAWGKVAGIANEHYQSAAAKVEKTRDQVLAGTLNGEVGLARIKQRAKTRSYWHTRNGAAARARKAATGGAIDAKAAADHAITLHNAEKWDTTEAATASAASWEACRDVDP